MNTLLISYLLILPIGDIDERPSLKRATAVYAVATALDWMSTLEFKLIDQELQRTGSRVRLVEKNRTVNWIENPYRMVLVGVVIDTIGTVAWNRIVGRKYPRIARAGLYLLSLRRFYLAYQNYRLCRPMTRCQL